jgi:hypothetical protein
MDLLKHQRQVLGIAKSWALKNLPGWSDDTHRDLLARHGAHVLDGRVSARTMGSAQIAECLKDYEKRGWPRRKTFAQKDAAPRKIPPAVAHIVRLWGRLGQAGKVGNASRPALLSFVERQTGTYPKSLDELTPAQQTAVIEALKSWLAR